jgi:hypothetical protein
MAIVDDRLREELRTRFTERLQEPVRLQLFIKPGSSRLILPSGVGCPTCPDAREIAEAIAEAARRGAADHLSGPAGGLRICNGD